MNDSLDANSAAATAKVADAAHEAVDKVAASAAQAEERLRNAASELEQRLRDTGHKAQESSGALTGDVKAYVHGHPVASLGIAFAAGAFVAALLRR